MTELPAFRMMIECLYMLVVFTIMSLFRLLALSSLVFGYLLWLLTNRGSGCLLFFPMYYVLIFSSYLMFVLCCLFYFYRFYRFLYRLCYCYLLVFCFCFCHPSFFVLRFGLAYLRFLRRIYFNLSHSFDWFSTKRLMTLLRSLVIEVLY